MIDPDAIPATMLLDSGVLIRALGQLADHPRAAVCRELWREAMALKKTILIAAPTVTEVTRNTNFPPAEIPSVPNVIVVAFDERTARLLSERCTESVTRNHTKPEGLPIDYIRYDAMIMACALANDAVLVCMDAKLADLASGAGLAHKEPEDFLKAPPPEHPQLPLPLNKGSKA